MQNLKENKTNFESFCLNLKNREFKHFKMFLSLVLSSWPMIKLKEWIKITVGYHFTPTRATMKKITSIDEDVEVLESSYIAGDNVKWWCFLENSLAFPQNVKRRVTMWPSNSIPKYIPKGIEKYMSTHIRVWTKTHTRILFVVPLFIIAKKWM